MSTRDHNPWDVFRNQYGNSYLPPPTQNSVSPNQMNLLHRWFTSVSTQFDNWNGNAKYELETYKLPEILNALQVVEDNVTVTASMNQNIEKQLEDIKKVIEAKEKRIDELMTIILENNIIMQDLLNQNAKLRDKLESFSDGAIDKLVEERVKNSQSKRQSLDDEIIEKLREEMEKNKQQQPYYPPYNPPPYNPNPWGNPTIGPASPNIYPTIWSTGSGGTKTNDSFVIGDGGKLSDSLKGQITSGGCFTVQPSGSSKSYIVGHVDKMTELKTQYVTKDTQE